MLIGFFVPEPVETWAQEATSGAEDGLSSIAGTSYGEGVVLQLGVVGNGAEDPTQVPTLQSTSTRALSNPGVVLTSPAGMYASAFASDEATGIMTGIQMTMDKLQVDFANVSSGFLATGQTNITINSNIPVGYSLYASEDLPLHLFESEMDLRRPESAVSARQIIEGTKCDDSNCNHEVAGVWINPDIAGFGYTVTGDDAKSDFVGGLYKAFADQRSGQAPQEIAGLASTSQYLTNRQVNVHYQVGVKPENEAGVYYNHVYYQLVPNF